TGRPERICDQIPAVFRVMRRPIRTPAPRLRGGGGMLRPKGGSDLTPSPIPGPELTAEAELRVAAAAWRSGEAEVTRLRGLVRAAAGVAGRPDQVAVSALATRMVPRWHFAMLN